MLNFKKLTVPDSNDTKEVDAVQMWEVRWESRHGQYLGETKPELECFTSEKLAKEFADSLRAAFRLIRHTWGTDIKICKAD